MLVHCVCINSYTVLILTLQIIPCAARNQHLNFLPFYTKVDYFRQTIRVVEGS